MLTPVAAVGVEPAPRLQSPRLAWAILGRLREELAWDVTGVRVTELCEWVRLPADLAELGGRHHLTLDPAKAHDRALMLLSDAHELRRLFDLRQRLKAVEEALWVAGVDQDHLDSLRPPCSTTDDPDTLFAAATDHAHRLAGLAEHIQRERTR